jgi:hypothetical protein
VAASVGPCPTLGREAVPVRGAKANIDIAIARCPRAILRRGELPVKAPVTLKTGVTETQRVASKPGLPSSTPERRLVTESARREYAAVIHARYQHADRRARGNLLDEYSRTTGCDRKAAIRRLRGRPRAARAGGGRPVQYVPRDLQPVLERAWRASDHLSAKLLRPILPALLTALATRRRCGRR